MHDRIILSKYGNSCFRYIVYSKERVWGLISSEYVQLELNAFCEYKIVERVGTYIFGRSIFSERILVEKTIIYFNVELKVNIYLEKFGLVALEAFS